MRVCFAIVMIFQFSQIFSDEEFATIQFNPPSGWHFADLKKYPETVKVVVVGKGVFAFPPQLILNTEKFSGTLKDYIQIVKKINETQNTQWVDLGMIETLAGSAHLSQVDVPTEWGLVQMMHVILVRDSYVYILNASALKDEFSRFYRDFFSSMRSLKYTQAIKE